MKQNFITTLRLVWGALLAGQIMAFMVISVIASDAKNPLLASFSLPFTLLGIAVGVLGKLLISPILLKNNLQTGKLSDEQAYHSAFVVACAMIESGNLLMIVMYFRTQEVNFLIGVIIGFFVFLSQIPMPDNITNQIEEAKKRLKND